MTKNEMIEALAHHYRIEKDENGKYDLNDYEWDAGCYKNNRWFSLAEVVSILEDYCDTDDWDD